MGQSHSVKTQAENEQSAEPLKAPTVTGEVGEKQDSKYLECGDKQGGAFESGKPHVRHNSYLPPMKMRLERCIRR